MILGRIRDLCKEHKLSISGLEKTLGLGNNTIGGWETASPRVDKLQLVADYFNVSLDYLVYGEKHGTADN